MNESNIESVVNKLNRQTKEDKIEWNPQERNPASLMDSERLLGIAYITETNGKLLRIYKYQYKSMYDIDVYEYVDSIRLEFIDDKGRPEWQFPQGFNYRDLYDTVTYKNSGADDFFKDFLKD